MSREKPELTVLLPVYNGEAYLREAIDSILEQTFDDFELLIVNDASQDESVAIIESYTDKRIRLLHNETNLGLAATLNRGLAEARSRWVARHDQDDISHKERLAHQMAYVRKHPETVLLGAQAMMIDEAGRIHRPVYVPRDPYAIRLRACFGNPVLHGTVLYDRDVVLYRYGGYDPNFPNCEDFEFWSRMLRDGVCLRNLRHSLLKYRQHGGSMRSAISGRKNEDYRLTLEANLRHILGEIPEIERISLRVWSFVLKTQYYEGGSVMQHDILAVINVIKHFDRLHPARARSLSLRMEKLRLFLVACLHAHGFGVSFRYAFRGVLRTLFRGSFA